MRRRTGLVAAAIVLTGSPAVAALSPAELDAAGARPPAGARLPGGAWIDQRGGAVRLAPDGRPAVLLFVDYSCRNVCGPGLTLTAGALHDAGLVAGRDYRLVAIGMDGDGPVRARAMAAERLADLPAEAHAALLLTGAPATVTRAEAALGYHAIYDAAADQFAHDAATFVFTRDGALSAVLPETAATPAQVRAAVARAAAGAGFVPAAPAAPQGLIGRVGALCYGLAAAHGVYAAPIVLSLRVGGVLICAALLAALLLLARRAGRRGLG